MKIRGEYAELAEMADNLHVDALAESRRYCERVNNGVPEPQQDEGGFYIETDWFK